MHAQQRRLRAGIDVYGRESEIGSEGPLEMHHTRAFNCASLERVVCNSCPPHNPLYCICTYMHLPRLQEAATRGGWLFRDYPFPPFRPVMLAVKPVVRVRCHASLTQIGRLGHLAISTGGCQQNVRAHMIRTWRRITCWLLSKSTLDRSSRRRPVIHGIPTIIRCPM